MDRHHFTNEYCTKKPVQWDYVPYHPVSNKESEYLRKLPVIVLTRPEVTPYDKFVPTLNPKVELVTDKLGQISNLEFIVSREIPGHETETYYVNSEGYEYCRYAFKTHL